MEIVKCYSKGRPRLRRVPDKYLLRYTSPGYALTPKDSWVLGRWSSEHDHILYLGGNTGSVGIVDARKVYANGGLESVFGAHGSLILDVCDVPKDNKLLTISGDTCIRLWDVNQGKLLSDYSTLFYGHDKTVRSISFSPLDTHVFVSVGRDGTLLRWDTRTPPKRMNNLKELAVVPNARYENAHTICDAKRSPGPRRRLKMNQEPVSVTSVQYIDNYHVVTGSQSARTGIRVWDMRCLPVKNKGSPCKTFHLPQIDKGVTSIRVDRYGANLYAAVTDGTVYEFNLQSSSSKPARRLCDARIASFYMQIDCCPDKDYVICGSQDGCAVIWDLQDVHHYLDDSPWGWYDRAKYTESLRPSWKLGGHVGEVCSVGWSRDSRFIFTMDDMEYRIWSAEDLDCRAAKRKQEMTQAGFERATKFELREEEKFLTTVERVSLTPAAPVRACLSPTKPPSRPGSKRKHPFTSPIKGVHTPSKRSPAVKQLRLEFASPSASHALAENRTIQNSPLSATGTPSKRAPRRPKNAFHAKYPTADLPDIRYTRHIQRLREAELQQLEESKPPEDKENLISSPRSMDDWLRRPSKNDGSGGRLMRVRLPSVTEFGGSACSHMITEEQRKEIQSPKKLVIKTPLKDFPSSSLALSPITSQSRTPATTSSAVTPQSNRSNKRKSVRNILHYFSKTPGRDDE